MKSESIIINPCHIDAGHESGLIVKEDTIKSIFNEIKKSIRNKKFDKADQLRYQLYAIDKRAINEIFESGRLIENAKRETAFEEELFFETSIKQEELLKKDRLAPGIYPEPVSNNPQHSINDFLSNQKTETSDYLKANGFKNGHNKKRVIFNAHWFQFYNNLPPKYLYCLMSSVNSIECTTDQTVITNGKSINRLYFINKGSAFVNYVNSSKKQIYLTEGDIIGDVSFFSRTKSPIAVVAAKGSELYYLEYTELIKLKSIFPDIDKTLFDLCQSHITRRHPDEDPFTPRFHERFNTEGVVSVQILNNKYEPFRGAIRNISYGGFAFDIETNNPEMVYSLKEKKIKAAIDIQSKDIPWVDILWGGQIININQLSLELYSIHVKGLEKNQNLLRLIKLLQNEKKNKYKSAEIH